MKPPHFDLQLVKHLTEEDRFALESGPACWGTLESYLHGEIGRYRPFAQSVVGSLSVQDFFRTKRWPEPHGRLADEYAICLSRPLLEEFEVATSTWYVKVEVQKGRKGQMLFFMSLHPLAFETHGRNGGELCPDTT